MIYCMWAGTETNREDCFEEATITIIAECPNNCFKPKPILACDKHTAIARKEENNPNYGCRHCRSPIKILRMTSA